MLDAVHAYLAAWQADPKQVRPFFKRLLDMFAHRGAQLEFVERSGVSASLRVLKGQRESATELFCLVDVIEDADGRWLSVCFYADSIDDPEEFGNLVPLGLLGEDGYCFDLEQPSAVLEDYVLERIGQAWVHVRGGGREN